MDRLFDFRRNMVKLEISSVFQELSKKLIKEYWDFYPTNGSRIGQHEYDGNLPDLSPYQTSRRERELQRGIAELHSIDVNNLNAQSRMGYQMMELFLRRELFVSKDLKPLENNPMRHVGHLNVSGYIRRNYAPLEDRLRSATKIMTQAPDFLDVLSRRLIDNLSSHVMDMSSESYSGMARFYRVDLADATK